MDWRLGCAVLESRLVSGLEVLLAAELGPGGWAVFWAGG
jgi:hypothetical protein